MGRPAKYDATTREALLDAAERLLVSGGPAAVTVRAVADEIGSSTRSVYGVFASKPAMLRALSARGFDHLAHLVESAPESDDPAADLAAVGVLAFRTFALSRPHLFRITFDSFDDESLRDPAVLPSMLRSYESLATRIDRVRAIGWAPSWSTPDLSFAYHSFCHGLAANELSREPPPVGAGQWRFLAGHDLEDLWRRSLAAFVAGLAPDRG